MSNAIFLILSLKYTEGNVPTWWRPNNAGYTDDIFKAGQYTQEQVENDPGYYNDGNNTLAVNVATMVDQLGLKLTVDLDCVKHHAKRARIAEGKRVSALTKGGEL